ncbi:MAG: CPBP family intramembrane metalloprotease [Tissierellia bacterium]|nr:CPBP family intramembrane metalloprotease [Tissierellia bacterium]
MNFTEFGLQLSLFQAFLITYVYLSVGLVLPATMDMKVFVKAKEDIRPIIGNIFLFSINILLILIFEYFFEYKIDIFSSFSLSSSLGGVLVAVSLYFVLDKLTDKIFAKIFKKSIEKYKEMMKILFENPASGIVRLTGFAPITEELLLRGYLLVGLSNSYGILIGLIVSTLIFAIIHFNIVQMISATISGLALGLLYIYTGNILACVIAHSFYNYLSYKGLEKEYKSMEVKDE